MAAAVAAVFGVVVACQCSFWKHCLGSCGWKTDPFVLPFSLVKPPASSPPIGLKKGCSNWALEAGKNEPRR